MNSNLKSEVTSRRSLVRRMALGAAGVGALSLGATSAFAAYDPNATAVDAAPGANGYGVLIEAGGLAHMRLIPDPALTAPTLTDRSTGELLVDANGTLHYVAGTGAGVASAFKPLATATSAAAYEPVRTLPGTQGRRIIQLTSLAAGTATAIDIATPTNTKVPGANPNVLAGVITIYANAGTFNGSEYLTITNANNSVTLLVAAVTGASKVSTFSLLPLDSAGKVTFTANGAGFGITVDLLGFFR